MDEANRYLNTPHQPRPSEPLPPHPAFATVGKPAHARKPFWILLVIILLAAVGYGVYYWQHTKVNDLQSQLKTAQQSVSQLNGKVIQLQKDNSSTAATGSIYKIPELGIQLTVPASLQGLTYYYSFVGFNGPRQSGTSMTADLSTTTLSSLDSQCTATKTNDAAKGRALGSLVRRTGTGTNAEDVTVLKQYSGYYIAYVQPQAACSSNSTTQATILTESKDLKASLSTIQPLQ